MTCLQLGTARGAQRLKPSPTWRRRSPTRQRPELRDGRGSSWPCSLPSFPVERREDRSSFRRTKVRWCEAPEERRESGIRKYFFDLTSECTVWRHGIGIEILMITRHAWMRLNFIFSSAREHWTTGNVQLPPPLTSGYHNKLFWGQITQSRRGLEGKQRK